MRFQIRDAAILLLAFLPLLAYAIANREPKHRLVVKSPSGKWHAEISINDNGDLIARTFDVTVCPETPMERFIREAREEREEFEWSAGLRREMPDSLRRRQ